MSLLEVIITIDAQLVTAVFTGIVASLVAYGTLKQRQVASKVAEVADRAQEVAGVINETHKIVNSQRTAMQELIKRLESENTALRAGEDPPVTEGT